MAAVVPDGLVCFFVSYHYLENTVATWYEQVCTVFFNNKFAILLNETCECSQQQGIIDSIGTETFTKEPKLAKLLRELQLTPVSYNKNGPLVFLACL